MNPVKQIVLSVYRQVIYVPYVERMTGKGTNSYLCLRKPVYRFHDLTLRDLSIIARKASLGVAAGDCDGHHGGNLQMENFECESVELVSVMATCFYQTVNGKCSVQTVLCAFNLSTLRNT